MVSHFQRVTVTMFWLTTRYVHCIKATHFVWAYAGVKLWILHCSLWHLKFVEPKKQSTLVSETSKIITQIKSVDTFHDHYLKSSTSVVTYPWKVLTGVVIRYFTRGNYFWCKLKWSNSVSSVNVLFRVNITGEKVERNISTIQDALQTYRSVYGMIYYIREYWSKCEFCVLIGYLIGWEGPILPARNFPRLVPPGQKSSLFSHTANLLFTKLVRVLTELPIPFVQLITANPRCKPFRRTFCPFVHLCNTVH